MLLYNINQQLNGNCGCSLGSVNAVCGLDDSFECEDVRRFIVASELLISEEFRSDVIIAFHD